MALAAARPAACSSRVRAATPSRALQHLAAAALRGPAALQAVAGARPAATQPPALEREKPALEVFPSVAVSRMLHDCRAFVESHR